MPRRRVARTAEVNEVQAFGTFGGVLLGAGDGVGAVVGLAAVVALVEADDLSVDEVEGGDDRGGVHGFSGCGVSSVLTVTRV